ncbi:MAG TPA: hypothetical protein DCL77_17410 [Prolixibacteraceae bacterium]|jgi:4-amino-4-deoxy-L-arabinose transferase-like glycosyltransferase|nr:hypothetical protein [Prolixibacteraceae bacterium]
MKNSNIKGTVTLKEVFFNKDFYNLLLVLGILALLKMVIAIQYDLDSEEAQYWLWNNHLQLSYYSKPPLIAYLNWLSTFLLGDTVFAIRLNAVILGFLISMATYLMSLELFKQPKTALLAALLTNIFPFLLHSSIIFTTDSPLILFWLCVLLFYWKAAETRSRVWWVLFGLSIGLGALSKYTIFLVFLPLALFSFKYHREIFQSRWFYVSILIALLLFSPVIYWNFQQKGVGFLHLVYLSGVFEHTQSAREVISNIAEFIAGQILLLLPFYQYPEVIRKWRQKNLTKEELFLLLPAVCMFVFFLIITIIRRSGAYMNWAMVAYTGMPILFSHFALRGDGWKLNRKIILVMVVCIFLFIILSLPSNRIIPLGKNNPANKLIGWSQLADKVDSLKDSIPCNSCYVISTSYHITSELSFYLDDQPEAYFLNINTRMTQFDLWNQTKQLINSDQTGILVITDRITPETAAVYDTILREDSCVIYSQNRPINTYYIYLVQGLKGIRNQYSSY